MRGIHHRDVGVLGALLLLDNIYYEIITDLNHLCPDMIRLIFRIQPYSKFCLISDSNYISGLPQVLIYDMEEKITRMKKD